MDKKTMPFLVAAMALLPCLVIATSCMRIPANNVVKTDSGLQIVSFNQDMTTLDVIKKMDEAGLRPAILEEVMKEPKRATTNGGLIYALGSISKLPGDERVCYSVPGCQDSDPVMSIDVKMFCDPRYMWPAGTNFGALPK